MSHWIVRHGRRVRGVALLAVAAAWSGVASAQLAERPADTAAERAADAAPAVLVGAGDIAGCDTDGDFWTAAILDTIPGVVFTTGDHAYPDGTFREFRECYEENWGRHKERTRPTPGNHDYNKLRGAAYYDYFGEAAGQRGRGYYSYKVGAWHVIVLNSEISMRRGSAQERWLREELAANPSRCTLAYWHKPLFSSVRRTRGEVKAMWDALYEAGADVVLAGHDHVYERFAPSRPDGSIDTERGIRQFTVGTGGRPLYPFLPDSAENSEVRQNHALGVLKLTLHEDSYEWEFISAPAEAFSDRGSRECH